MKSAWQVGLIARTIRILGLVSFSMAAASSALAQDIPTPVRGGWFAPTISDVPVKVIDRMVRNGSFPADSTSCPVRFEDLRAVTAVHLNMDGGLQLGQVIVHETVAEEVASILVDLYFHGFAIDQMVPGLTDEESMRANNTSGFNCGTLPRDIGVAGSFVSPKAEGLAIDINPRMNPFIRPLSSDLEREFNLRPGSGYEFNNERSDRLNSFCIEWPEKCLVLPPEGRKYIKRDGQKGQIMAGGVVENVFASWGWRWGGHWPLTESDKVRSDYQRFERKLRK